MENQACIESGVRDARAYLIESEVAKSDRAQEFQKVIPVPEDESRQGSLFFVSPKGAFFMQNSGDDPTAENRKSSRFLLKTRKIRRKYPWEAVSGR